MSKRAAVIATGWVGDTIICSSVANALHLERDFQVDFYIKWPQLKSIFECDPNYRTLIYKDTRWGNYRLWQKLKIYDLIVKEPSFWSYREPKTVEIKKIAGCAELASYSLQVQRQKNKTNHKSGPPSICISRDIYKKAYDRNIDEIVAFLERKFKVKWIGLDPNKSSKKGTSSDLMDAAITMLSSDCFFGPEGGMLWLAGGIGVKTIYLTEHIANWKPLDPIGDPWKSLGLVNYFPSEDHVAIAPYCSNEEVLGTIEKALVKWNLIP